MKDILGNAISDFYFNRSPAKLWVHDEHGPKVEMPVVTYFRNKENLNELEQIAIAECRGRVLDIGAGAGSHALILQDKGVDVMALDISPGNISVMQDRGVNKIVNLDIFEYKSQPYDTLLLLMNGIGLAGSIDGLRLLLQHFKTLLAQSGQLLFDSSDVAYLYEHGLPKSGPYYGEIACRYQYKSKKTDWYTWLYIDQHLMKTIAAEEGWELTILFEDDDDQYLGRLTLVRE